MAEHLSTARPAGHESAYDRRYKLGEKYKADQRARMKARYWAVKRLGAKALEGHDLDHIKPLAEGGSGTAESNLRVRSIHSNRGDKSFIGKASYHPHGLD